MKFLLIILLAGTYLTTSAQTIIESAQTANNDEILAVNVVGKRNGNPFRHTLRFDVKGLSSAQRDSLYEQTMHTLSVLGINSIPGLTKSRNATEIVSEKQANNVTFRCENCDRKGWLEVYGNGYTVTRIIDGRSDKGHAFPMQLQFAPGDYKLLYYERHGLKRVLQNQVTFTAQADKMGIVSVK